MLNPPCWKKVGFIFNTLPPYVGQLQIFKGNQINGRYLNVKTEEEA